MFESISLLKRKGDAMWLYERTNPAAMPENGMHFLKE